MAQTFLDVFILPFADFNNEAQKTLFLEINKYFTDIQEGTTTATLEEMANKLGNFVKAAEQLGFKPLGDSAVFKEKIKESESKRLM